MTFHVGQLVVCVNDRLISGLYMKPWLPPTGDLDGLKRGTIYTIRGNIDLWCDPSVYLLEIVRPREPDEIEPPYTARRFRPVDETSIAGFRKALTSAPVGEEVA